MPQELPSLPTSHKDLRAELAFANRARLVGIRWSTAITWLLVLRRRVIA
jgi:hypothetical protein